MTDQTKGGSDAPDENTLRAEGAKAEQNRIAGIVNSEDAKGREALANHFAFKTTMSVEDAIAALAASPKTEPKAAEAPAAPGKNALAEAMAKSGNPDVALDGGGDEEEIKQAKGKGLASMAAELGYTAKTH